MFWQGVEVHLKEIHSEFTVDVVEFVFVFAILLIQVFLIDLFEVMEIVRTFHVNAFVNDKVLTILLMGQGITAMGAAQGKEFGKAVLIRGEGGITDLALNLSLSPVVAVKVGHWSITAGTGAVLWDIAFHMSGNRFDFYVVPIFKVGDEELPVPFILVELYFREFIRFEFLILRRV